MATVGASRHRTLENSPTEWIRAVARNARREARAAGVAYLKEKLDWEDLQAIEDRADLWSQRLREARDRDERLSGEVPRPGGAQA